MAFSAHDQVPDSPTNNFATLNPLDNRYGYNLTLSEGNLKAVASGTSATYSNLISIYIPKSGKWYYEYNVKQKNIDASGFFRMMLEDTNKVSVLDIGYAYSSSGETYYDGFYKFYSGSSAAVTHNQGDVFGIAVDRDNDTVYLYRNGGLVTSASISSSTTELKIFFAGRKGSVDNIYIANFGQDPTFGGNKSPSSTYSDANGIGSFYYQPPTGALALCTANLPDPDIDPNVDDLPEDYFKSVIWTGQTVGGAMTSWDGTTGTVDVGFQPDLVWIKNRSHLNNHSLYNVLSGAQKLLISNTTDLEQTDTTGLLSFDTDGFSVGTATRLNGSSRTYVAWCWKAGGAPDLTSSPTKPFAKDNVQYETLSAAGITAGTITPTAMSVNTKAGFSIVNYTTQASGTATVPHGLSQAPEFFVVKTLSVADQWRVYSKDLGAGYQLYLNDTSGATPTTNRWNNTAPSSNVFSLGTDNATSTNYIAYCWHSVAGYSAFGSYTGNGSTDGPFVYTGFKPAFVMWKRTDVSNNWVIVDTERDINNPAGSSLQPNNSNQESVYERLDLLSNGFKLRQGGTGWLDQNASSGIYIYAAFAEMPFKYATAR